MTPTPRSSPSFQNFRFRRRPNTIPFQHDVTPVAGAPITPQLHPDDQGIDLRRNEGAEESEDEEPDEDEDIDIGEERVDGEEEEEEGGIEEGL
jgi:hypothetical protein